MGFFDWFRRGAAHKRVDELEVSRRDLRPISNAHFSVPEGYELVRSDQIDALKAEMPPTDEPSADPKGIYWDPFALVEQLGFREKPTAVTYKTLDSMVWRVPLVQAIVQTRLNQISAFCTPLRHRFDLGFRVKMRAIQDRPTRADKKFMTAMERMLLNGGTTDVDPRARDSFEVFVRKFVRDSLIYDQATFEVIPDRAGRPAEWNALDASTIRLANTNKLYPNTDIDDVFAVQIYDNVTVAEFSRKEIAFGVRNPRSSILSYGYGTPELEMLVTSITSILWATRYNQNFFSQGTVAKGLLNLKGAIPEKQMRAFRRQWYQMVSGIENAFRTPVTNAEDVQWINMQNSNRDMEFSAWMDFLIKQTCGVFNIDPIEVGFKYGNTGQQRAMFEGANKSKITESKDRGLRPLLKFVERMINQHIIWPINPEFSLEFVGLDSMTAKERADLMTQRARTMYTVDELRAEEDLNPLPNGEGAVILDGAWMQSHREQVARLAMENEREHEEVKPEVHAIIGATAADVQVHADSEEEAEKSLDNEIGLIALDIEV